MLRGHPKCEAEGKLGNMIKIHFALVGAAALALAACGSAEDDALEENVGENLQADELNALADNAAADAQAEMDALANQQEQLEAAPATSETTSPTEDVTTEPSDVEDEPLGM